MAVAYLDDSNPVANATSVTPTAVAATLAEGDHALICVNFKRPGSATLATPSGWEKIVDETVGTGSAGAGTGQIKLMVFYKKAGASGSLGTLPTLTLGGTTTGSVIQAALIVYRGDLGADSVLLHDYTVASDSSSDTTFSLTGGSNPGIKTDDRVLLFGALTTQAPNFSGTPTIAATGVTFGTVNNPWNTSTGTGDDMRSFAWRTQATAGTSSAAPTSTATLDTASTGGGVFIRLRENTSAGSTFDLDDWKLNLPTDGGDVGSDSDEVVQPTLDTYVDENFYLDDENRLVLIAPVQGATTSGSGATRCELREMENGVAAAWDPAASGLRQLTVTMTADPTNITDRKEMIVAQIHGATGTPPLYVAIEHHTSPTRLRVYKDGPGVSNFLENITAGDVFTVRLRANSGTIGFYCCLGTASSLPGSPDLTWSAGDFTDDTDWYFKTGAYNKSEVADLGTGEAITKISFLELIQPTTHEETGAAVASGAGSGHKAVTTDAETYEKTGSGCAVAAASGPLDEVDHALTVEKTGAAAGTGAGSGVDAIEHPIPVTGAGVSTAAGSGAKAVERPRAGSVAASAAGSGVDGRDHQKVGSGVSSGAGSGSRSIQRSRDGAAVASGAGSGPGTVTHATTYTKTGAAVAVAAGTGDLGFTYQKSGSAAFAGASSGAKVRAYPVVLIKVGSSPARAAGSGACALTPATTRAKTGGSAASAAASGPQATTSATTYTKTGAAVATVAGSGTGTVPTPLPPTVEPVAMALTVTADMIVVT